jgi:pimeloyl-ACP methyl ester carboxylesterase
VSLEERYAAVLDRHGPRQVLIDGLRWELIEAGAGATVLLLPGGFGIAATSFQYLAELAHDYHVIALTYPPELARIAALADGVAAILDQGGIASAHVVGGSASGAVAQVLVRRHTARVATLILAQTGPPQPQRVWLAEAGAACVQAMPAALSLALLRAAVLSFLPRANASHAFWRAHFTAVIAAQSRNTLAARLHAMADYDRTYHFTPSDLAAWPGRVAIIEASHDGLLSATERARLRQLYPRARRYVLTGGRHADSVIAPHRQLALIRAALAEP